MKKVVLSALAATIVSSAVYADTMTLFTDPKTGQVFTTAGEGRIEMGDFISAKEVDIANRETSSFIAEYKEEDKKSVTSIDPKSPKFILGQETGPNMKIKSKDNKDMYMKVGVRLQSTFERREKDYVDNTKDIETNDAYMRRVRLEVEAGFDKHTAFVMDMRNDNPNAEDGGEKTFNVGDAYLNISKPFDTSLVNFKLYRGKIDVSRSETAKSAHNVHYDRSHIADEAAQYITHNRRGTNAQMYGDWNKKVHYQVAVGDGVYSGAFKDAKGKLLSASTTRLNTGSLGAGAVSSQDFFYGGKIKLSPFDGWEETKLTETYMGQGKHFTVGAAYWKTGNIVTTAAAPLNHELINIEASAHYNGASITAEYFDFDGVVKDWTATTKTIGESNGWYGQAEYVFTDFGYVAPFYRYESWDKFKGVDGYDLTSKIAGVNWYLRGNTTKVGFAIQKDTYGSALSDYSDTRFKVTSQFHF